MKPTIIALLITLGIIGLIIFFAISPVELNDSDKLQVMKPIESKFEENAIEPIVEVEKILSKVYNEELVYVSNLQYDITISGNDVVGYDKCKIYINSESGDFKIQIDGINESQNYKIKSPYPLWPTEVDDIMVTDYWAIVNDPNYKLLKTVKYKTSQTYLDYEFIVTFSIIGMDGEGNVLYYTTFYAE